MKMFNQMTASEMAAFRASNAPYWRAKVCRWIDGRWCESDIEDTTRENVQITLNALAIDGWRVLRKPFLFDCQRR